MCSVIKYELILAARDALSKHLSTRRRLSCFLRNSARPAASTNYEHLLNFNLMLDDCSVLPDEVPNRSYHIDWPSLVRLALDLMVQILNFVLSSSGWFHHSLNTTTRENKQLLIILRYFVCILYRTQYSQWADMVTMRSHCPLKILYTPLHCHISFINLLIII